MKIFISTEDVDEAELIIKAAKMESDLLWIYSIARETVTHSTNVITALDRIEEIAYNYLH